LLTCAHAAWKSTSAPLLFCTSGEETVENLKSSRGQLAPCQEKRIKRQQTVSSARCKVLAQNAGFLLASMPFYCRFQPIECSYSELVSVSVPQDKIRGSAILRQQFASLRDSAHHVGTRATFWSHVCNGPATNAKVGSGVGCPRKFVSDISSPSREGPSGPLGVSWNRGLVTFEGFSRAPVQNRER